MKKSFAILAALAALAAPLSAQAHRAWLAPTATVLSGTDAWVGFDAGMSNGVFIPDHAAMNLAGLVITAPDGSTAAPENMVRARYRSSFDLHLTQAGTWRVANVMSGVVVSYKENGEQKRWRGTEAEMAAAIPAGATDVSATRSDSRIETFVTLGAPSTTALAPTGKGIELVPVTHPNDLVAGEAATFKLVRDGQPAADMDVTIARGGTRYRDNPEEMTVKTGADGSFTVTWPEAGMYWMNASVRTPAQADQMAASAQYNGVVEVLPLTDGMPSGAGNRVLIPTHGRLPSRPPGRTIWDFAGQSMGTDWSVRLVAPPDRTRAQFQAAIDDELAQVIALFSHWEPTSELSRWNAAPGRFWAVSDPFWSVLNAAMDLADDTDGAVDPTLGALVDLWGFGPPGPRTGLPTDEEIAVALPVSGWQSLRLNREARAVQQVGGMKLDLSGIAKGHAVDRVSERPTALGATSHLVEIGGELRGAGVKPDARPWWTELQAAPGAPGPRTLAALFDIAVATSGDWVRRFNVFGQTYGHTLDGRTGRPVSHGVASVSVFAETAMRADALATALMVMGPEEGPAYAATDLAAMFVMHGPDGMTEHLSSPALIAMLDEGAE